MLLLTLKIPVFPPSSELPIFKLPPVTSKLAFSAKALFVSQLRIPPSIVDVPPKKVPVTVVSAVEESCVNVPVKPELSPAKTEVPLLATVPVPDMSPPILLVPPRLRVPFSDIISLLNVLTPSSIAVLIVPAL